MIIFNYYKQIIKNSSQSFENIKCEFLKSKIFFNQSRNQY